MIFYRKILGANFDLFTFFSVGRRFPLYVYTSHSTRGCFRFRATASAALGRFFRNKRNVPPPTSSNSSSCTFNYLFIYFFYSFFLYSKFHFILSFKEHLFFSFIFSKPIIFFLQRPSFNLFSLQCSSFNFFMLSFNWIFFLQNTSWFPSKPSLFYFFNCILFF